jgi:hypothetical protein
VRSSVIAALVACSPGVGRPPLVEDASVARDALPKDAEPEPDAEPRDMGPSDIGVFVPDSGVVPSYPFTGVFGILNDNEQLYAREMDGALMLVVGSHPYIYTGTIDADGNVLTSSALLERSGCVLARVTGTYDRTAATYMLRHETCSVQGGTIDGTIRGGFDRDYVAQSGVYALTATVTIDLNGCAPVPLRTDVKVGVNILSDNTVAAFTGVDLVSEPGVYLGRSTGGGFSATQSLDRDFTQRFAMSAVFSQVSVNDPLVMAAERDVFNPDGDCTFRIAVTGERTLAP